MSKKKYNIILDLDQTIISSEIASEFDVEKYQEKAGEFMLHNMDGYYFVFERPGLQEFLDHLFATYNVSVFTAASKDYGLFIIDNCILTKPKRKLDYYFYDYHCGEAKKKFPHKKCHKDLRLLFDTYDIKDYNKNNTIIIDDHKDVKFTNKDNCILIKEFYFFNKNSEKDKVLKNIKKQLQKKCK